jgi:hypothetical protein
MKSVYDYRDLNSSKPLISENTKSAIISGFNSIINEFNSLEVIFKTKREQLINNSTPSSQLYIENFGITSSSQPYTQKRPKTTLPPKTPTKPPTKPPRQPIKTIPPSSEQIPLISSSNSMI